MKSCAVRLITMAVFGLIGLAIMIWMNQGAAPLKPTVPFDRLPLAEQQRREGAVHDLQSQIDALRISGRRSEHKPFTLTIDNEELDTLLQTGLSSGRYPVRAVQCEIRTGEIVLQGIAKVHDADTTVNIGGNIAAEKGALAFQLNSLQIDGLPAPTTWKDKAQDAISKRLNSELTSKGLEIASVQLDPGVMTIKGVTD